ncbi:MAG: hypothetical protein ABOK23_07900 [Candidatus Methanoperedens sp.]|nr:hypothetical protein [Candidatus Methanoperedens sp.]MCZ7394821.1 hypothetical protein [Candidatus Methanoperedens sp.]
MVEVYGYLLSDDERKSIRVNPNAPANVFVHTDEKYAYNEKAKKIAMLLILSDLVQRVDFDINERRLFEDLGRTIYENIGIKTGDMKVFGKLVLLEQATIAIVSNWESYFSSILKKIFDDDEFIKRGLDQKEKFKKFLNDFRLFSDFQQIITLNKNKFEDLHFGTYIIENKKISFQELQKTKNLLKLLFDIDIVNLSTDWNEIDKLFEARHILVHSPSDTIVNNQKFRSETNGGKNRVSDIYTKTKVETVMRDIASMIEKIDMELFGKYDTEYMANDSELIS